MAGNRLLLLASLTTCICLHVCATDPKAQETFVQWREIRTQLNFGILKEINAKCTATKEESFSWIQLDDLFKKHVYSGVMRFAWPRLAFFQTEFAPLLNKTKDDLKKMTLCSSSIQDDLICINETCQYCTDLWGDPEKDKYLQDPEDQEMTWKELDYCLRAVQSPEKAPTDGTKPEDLDYLILQPGSVTGGPLTLPEVMEWKKVLEEQKSRDLCTASVEMSVSAGYMKHQLLRSLSTTEEQIKSELEEHPDFFADKLKGLKGADKTRAICGDFEVCGWDGACVYCGQFENEDPQDYGYDAVGTLGKLNEEGPEALGKLFEGCPAGQEEMPWRTNVTAKPEPTEKATTVSNAGRLYGVNWILTLFPLSYIL